MDKDLKRLEEKMELFLTEFMVKHRGSMYGLSVKNNEGERLILGSPKIKLEVAKVEAEAIL